MADKVEIPEPNWASKTPKDLAGCLPAVVGKSPTSEVTTGLNEGKIAPVDIGEVKNKIKEMGMRKRFQKDDIEDCTERAIWCMAHLRYMYPGIPVGMVEGKINVGAINGNHAVLVVWDKDLKPNYIDPQQIDKTVNISPADIKRITSIPLASDDQKNSDIEPFKSIGGRLKRLKNQYVNWDKNYWIYSYENVKAYLKELGKETVCEGKYAHDREGGNLAEYWGSTDAAFWAYAHLRRHFPGCATGIAHGFRKGKDKAQVFNLIFTENKDKIQPIYWMQTIRPELRAEVLDFTPDWVCF